MPLIKDISREAFKKNVETEINAGKTQKEAVAIAFGVRRQLVAEAAKRQAELRAKEKEAQRIAARVARDIERIRNSKVPSPVFNHSNIVAKAETLKERNKKRDEQRAKGLRVKSKSSQFSVGNLSNLNKSESFGSSESSQKIRDTAKNVIETTERVFSRSIRPEVKEQPTGIIRESVKGAIKSAIGSAFDSVMSSARKEIHNFKSSKERQKASPKGSKLKLPKVLPQNVSRNEPLLREARVTPRSISKVLDRVLPKAFRRRKID